MHDDVVAPRNARPTKESRVPYSSKGTRVASRCLRRLFPLAMSQMSSICSFLTGILFAGLISFYFYYTRPNGTRLETIGEATRRSPSPGRVDMKMQGCLVTETVEADSINQNASGHALQNGVLDLVSHGEKVRDPERADATEIKKFQSATCTIQVRSLLEIKPATTGTRVPDGAGEVADSSKVTTNELPYTIERQHLNRDGEWKTIDNPPDSGKYEFIVLRREHRAYDSIRINTFVDIKDDAMKQTLQNCILPEGFALFDDDELVS
jgi:hypothetical protein